MTQKPTEASAEVVAIITEGNQNEFYDTAVHPGAKGAAVQRLEKQ